MWYLENKGEILRIRINQSYYQTPGPFLIEDVEIDWNLNYSKLRDDEELWLTTNYNAKKYEIHFVHYQ